MLFGTGPEPLRPTHPDHAILAPIYDDVLMRVRGGLGTQFLALAREALEFVLDPVRTARTRLSELDKVEKTFVGLKLEHFLRDWLDVPRGAKRDLQIAGHEVDVKNTVAGNWSIPEETYRNAEPCLLTTIDDKQLCCSLGLFVARAAYFNAGTNRDTKKGISSEGRKQIVWLVKDAPYPPSRFDGLDMTRFRALRKLRGGNLRAAQFFREQIGRPVSRIVIQSLLHDQKDPMKRLRANGGADDILRAEGLRILIGDYTADRALAEAAGIAGLEKGSALCVAVSPPALPSPLR